ncbi:MAG: hypothetical protein WCG42_03975, partial [Parachlamydiaceae bacterium]
MILASLLGMAKGVCIIVKGYSVYNAGRTAYSVSQNKERTIADVVNGVAQGVFCVMQVGVAAETVMHVRNVFVVVTSVGVGGADVVRTAAAAIASKDKLDSGDILPILAATTSGAGNVLSITLQPHMEHIKQCGEWVCQHKDGIQDTVSVMLAGRSVVDLYSSTPNPVRQSVVEQLVVEQPVVKQPIIEQLVDEQALGFESDKEDMEYAKNWESLDFIPERIARIAKIPFCKISNIPIRYLMYISIGNEEIYVEKSSVYRFFTEHPNGNLEGYAKSDFKFSEKLQKALVDDRLRDWAIYQYTEVNSKVGSRSTNRSEF